MPMRYLASLFSAGNESIVEKVSRKLIAVRVHMRAKTVGDMPESEAMEALAQGGITAEIAEAIHRLTALPTYNQRFVIPPMAREVAVGETTDPFNHKPAAGFGQLKPAERRWYP